MLNIEGFAGLPKWHSYFVNFESLRNRRQKNKSVKQTSVIRKEMNLTIKTQIKQKSFGQNEYLINEK